MNSPLSPGDLKLSPASGSPDRAEAPAWAPTPGPSAAQASSTSRKPVSDDVYEAIATQIERENALINQRLSWTLQINGFLFTALALLSSRATLDSPMLLLSNRLIPLTGLCVSVGAFLGVLAAHHQLDYLTREWENMAPGDPRPRPFGNRGQAYLLGVMPSILPATSLVVVWLCLMVMGLGE